jgi:hypothetical protein
MTDIRPMHYCQQDPPEILCPRRHAHVSSMECHVCHNHLKVQRCDELYPELQCGLYDFSPIGLDPSPRRSQG